MQLFHRVKNLLVFVAAAIFVLAGVACVRTSVGETLSADIMRRYQPTINGLSGHGWDHSNSVVLHGMEKIYLKRKNPAQLAYIKRFVDEHVNEDGSINGLLDTLDGMQPGVLCLFLYEQTGAEKYRLAAQNMRNHLLGDGTQKPAIPQTPEGGFWHKNQQKYRDIMSVDGAYMAYPFLLRYGLLTNDAQAVDMALMQTLMVSEKSFNHQAGLPYHTWDYNKTKSWANPQTGQSTQFWSRASGWYAMALVDMLEVLPQEHKDYARLLGYYLELANGLMRWQDEKTGLWFHVLDQAGKAGNYPEMAGSGMMVYALAKGARLGLLDNNATLAAKNAWRGMQIFIKPYKDGGLQIQSVAPGMSTQDDYEAYVKIRPVSVPSDDDKQHAHGYMAVLLAASEME